MTDFVGRLTHPEQKWTAVLSRDGRWRSSDPVMEMLLQHDPRYWQGYSPADGDYCLWRLERAAQQSGARLELLAGAQRAVDAPLFDRLLEPTDV